MTSNDKEQIKELEKRILSIVAVIKRVAKAKRYGKLTVKALLQVALDEEMMSCMNDGLVGQYYSADVTKGLQYRLEWVLYWRFMKWKI